MNVRARSTVDLAGLRVAGLAMVTAAAVLPALPGPDGIPCPLRTLTGIPCPLCGMTTSVTAAVQLEPLAALAANPAGVLAVLVALGLLLFRGPRQLSFPVWVLPPALVLMEIWQLVRFGVV